MPQFNVTDPETKQTYRITAPEGATNDEVIAKVKEHQAQEDLPDYGMHEEAMNTATFGLSDRVRGAGKAFSDYLFDKEGDGYIGDPSNFEMSDLYTFPKLDKRIAQQHTARDQWRKENPMASLGAGIVGGMGNPLANVASKWAMGGKLAGSGLNPVTKIGAGRAKLLGKQKQSLGEAVGRGAVGAGGMAGFQAFNEADGDFLDRLYQATDAVVIGGMVGGGVPATVRGASGALRTGVNQLARTSKQQQRSLALRKIAEALEADGLSPEQAIQKIQDLGPQGALLDAGDKSRMLAFAVSKRSEKGAKEISDFVEGRQLGRRDPVTGEKISGQVERVDQSLDDLGYGGANKKEEFARLQKEASDLYEQAYKANKIIDDPTVNDLLRKIPEGIKIKARQAMNMAGENVSMVNPELTKLGREQGIVTGRGIGEGLKLKYLDRIKKALWDASEKERGDTGKLTDVGTELNNLRKKLTVALDDADTTGFYKQARAKAGDKLSNESALRSGQRFMLDTEFTNANELAEELADMNPNELHYFRMGVIEKLKGLASKVPERGDVTNKLMGNKNIEDRVRFAFQGDEGLFKRYIDDLSREREMFKGYGVRQNSQTAEKTKALGDSDIDPNRAIAGATDMANQNWVRGGINLLGALKDKVTMPEKSSEALAKMLTGRGEGLVEDLADKFKYQGLSRNIKKQATKGLTRAILPEVGKRKKRRRGMLSP